MTTAATAIAVAANVRAEPETLEESPALETTGDPRKDWRAFWTFYLLAVLLGIALLPYAASSTFMEGVAAIENTGIRSDTSMVTGLRTLVADGESIKGVVLLVLGPATPLIAALIVVPIFFSRSGLRELAGRLRFWRGVPVSRGLVTWGLLIAFYTVMNLTVAGVRMAFLPESYSAGYHWDFDRSIVRFAMLLLAALFLDGGGLLEETGWRGFAMPLLQRHLSPMRTALFLGLLWGLWHVPIKFATLPALWEAPGYFVSYYAIYLCGAVGLTIIIHTFVNLSGGSLLIAIAAHGLGNDSIGLRGVWGDWASGAGRYQIDSLLVGLGTMTGVIVVFAVVAVVVTRGRLGLGADRE